MGMKSRQHDRVFNYETGKFEDALKPLPQPVGMMSKSKATPDFIKKIKPPLTAIKLDDLILEFAQNIATCMNFPYEGHFWVVGVENKKLLILPMLELEAQDFTPKK